MLLTKHPRSFSGFTLVELIVTITILAILGTIGFMSFSKYQSDARDGKRITNVSTIAQGFDINMAAGKLINTSETSTGYNIVITGSTFTMTGYYGTVNNTLLNSLKVYSKDITTTTDYPYSYSYFPTERKYQVSSYLENSSNLPTAVHFIDHIINQTYADTNTGYIVVKGNFSATGGINSLIPTTTAWTAATGTPKVIAGYDTVVPGTSTSAPPAPVVCASGYEWDGTSCVNYTKLLIHSNETYGGTTMTDSSPNNQTISAFSGAHHEANSPFGGSSIFFSGSSDYLSLADSNDWDFGTNDFTIDGWLKIDDSNEVIYPVLYKHYQDANNYWILNYSPSTDTFRINNRVAGLETIDKSWTGINLSGGYWYHFALIKVSGSFYLYVNGIQQGSAYANSVNINFSGPVTIMNSSYISGWYMDEIRVSTGIARWTSNFTPPTTRYTADSYTKLLIHSNTTDGSTTFTDSETTPKTITRYGDAKHKIIPAKFGNSSLSFDGVDDYLTLPDSEDWNFGTGDFTIDGWIYPKNIDNDRMIIGQAVDASNRWYLNVAPTNALQFYSTTGISFSAQNKITLNTWNHIALVRNGTSFKGYVNGIEAASITSALLMPNLSANLNIGRQGTITDYYFNGYMDELRISKGIARWTSNFTPPTAPY